MMGFGKCLPLVLAIYRRSWVDGPPKNNVNFLICLNYSWHVTHKAAATAAIASTRAYAIAYVWRAHFGLENGDKWFRTTASTNTNTCYEIIAHSLSYINRNHCIHVIYSDIHCNTRWRRTFSKHVVYLSFRSPYQAIWENMAFYFPTGWCAISQQPTHTKIHFPCASSRCLKPKRNRENPSVRLPRTESAQHEPILKSRIICRMLLYAQPNRSLSMTRTPHTNTHSMSLAVFRTNKFNSELFTPQMFRRVCVLVRVFNVHWLVVFSFPFRLRWWGTKGRHQLVVIVASALYARSFHPLSPFRVKCYSIMSLL